MRTYHNLEHWCTGALVMLGTDAGHWLCAGSCGLGAALRGLQSEVTNLTETLSAIVRRVRVPCRPPDVRRRQQMHQRWLPRWQSVRAE